MPISSRISSVLPNSVGSTELQNTAVTPASYTNADITVDEDGRITSAANGSAVSITSHQDKTSNGTITGVINGINKIFVLAGTPLTNSLIFTINGLPQESVTHYSLVIATITLSEAPVVGDSMTAFYTT